ncbi:unnamed protein product, partial [Meganyctiphanes norvegica]
ELTCPINSVIEAGDKQFAFFICRKTYSQALDFCHLYGWALATPDEQLVQFNDGLPVAGEYWLDVLPDTTAILNGTMPWYWQTSPKKNLTIEAQWMVGSYNVATINSDTNCATYFKNHGLLAHNCALRAYFACESFIFFNKQRSEVTPPPVKWYSESFN